MKCLLMSSIALSGALLLSSAAWADDANANKEVATAIEHAHLSLDSQSVAVADLHLHHSINCLVGPHGADFDAAAGNPCKGMGNGALRDAPKHSQLHSKALRALAAARRGVAAHDLPAVHAAASEVAKILGPA